MMLLYLIRINKKRKPLSSFKDWKHTNAHTCMHSHNLIGVLLGGEGVWLGVWWRVRASYWVGEWTGFMSWV